MLISCEKCQIFLVSNQHIYTIQLLFRDGMKDLLFTDLKFLSIFAVTSKQIKILNPPPRPPQPHFPNKKLFASPFSFPKLLGRPNLSTIDETHNFLTLEKLKKTPCSCMTGELWCLRMFKM